MPAARSIDALSNAVYLSRETALKINGKHQDKVLQMLTRAPEILSTSYVRVEHPKHLIFIHHDREPDKIRSYKAVVKRVRDEQRLLLVALHRVDKTSVRSTYRKTVSVKQWERRRREVGPPKNPT